MNPKKVFISYAWEDQDFAEKILNFSNTLREHGIDATIDQYEENPDQGWPIWMENQIENSDFVLIVCTKTYLEKFKQVQTGKGVSWECGAIYQKLYELQGHNNKYIPIIFSDNDIQNIVPALKPFTFYNVEKNLQKLENRINGIPNTVKPPVKTPALPAKERKSMFITSPIDVELWNKAKWGGVGFVCHPEGWLMGLVFNGDKKSALKIFENWQKIPNLDEYLTVTFIEGDIERLPKNGYTCLLTPNMEESLKRAQKFCEDTDIILTFNRFQRMYPTDNFKCFNIFKNLVLNNIGKKLVMVPLTKKDKNSPVSNFAYDININKAVGISNIKYKDADKIKQGDIESCVIPKFNKDFPLN